MNNNLFAYFITIAAFAFFVVCPRLGAMTDLLDKHSELSIYWIVLIGTFASIPLLILMTWVIRHWGLMAGLGLGYSDRLHSSSDTDDSEHEGSC